MNSQLGIQEEGEFKVVHIAKTDEGCDRVRESEGCHSVGREPAVEGLEEGEMLRPYRASSAEVHGRGTPVVMYDGASEEGRSEESIATVAERTMARRYGP